MEHSVTITESGRSGTVTYREPAGTLSGYWEFGGGNVLAIVQMGDSASWKKYPWAVERRASILRAVADEVIRQRAPSARADIDEVTGDITLVQGDGPDMTAAPAADVAFVRRYSRVKAIAVVVVLVGALIFGGVFWSLKKVFSIDPGSGTPTGYAVRTDEHIAILIQHLEAYVPSLHRDHSKDRYSISMFVVPLDGSDTHLVPIREGLEGNSFSLAQVIGSDGRAMWYDGIGSGAVDLKTFKPLKPSDLRDPPDRTKDGSWPLGPRVEYQLAAGLFTSPTTWLGLHSVAEAERDFKPGSGIKRVVHAEDAKQQRLLYSGVLDPDSSYGRHPIISMTALNENSYFNAAFLRMAYEAEPIHMHDPDGALMIYTSAPGLNGTTVMARVDLAGNVVWKADTGIDRFHLQQILPGEGSTAFVGTRPPVPDKLSEPLMVIVEHSKGSIRTISLWQ